MRAPYDTTMDVYFQDGPTDSPILIAEAVPCRLVDSEAISTLQGLPGGSFRWVTTDGFFPYTDTSLTVSGLRVVAVNVSHLSLAIPTGSAPSLAVFAQQIIDTPVSSSYYRYLVAAFPP